jgi:tagatose 6-phosphate kinase
MPKFITVTPNPAIDRTYLVNDFETGEVNRAGNVLASAGGKGINVARVLKTLGGNGIATGFAGGLAGEQFVGLLDIEDIPHSFLDVSPGETRFAIVVADLASGRQTVINEQGPELTDDYITALENHITGLAQGTDGIVFSGSLPVGVSAKRYRTLIEHVKGHAKLTLLDATGPMLTECVGAKPSILKINRNEARTLGVIIEDWNARAKGAALDICRNLGIEYVALTDGAMGAVLAGSGGVSSAITPKLQVASAVGSGDSFAAGLIYALSDRPDDLPGALRLAAACGGANALTYSPGSFTSEQIESVSGRIILG